MSRRTLTTGLTTVSLLLLSLLSPNTALAEPYGPSDVVPPLTATGQAMDQTNNTVFALAYRNGVLYAGGSFTTVRPARAAIGTSEQPQAYLAAFDSNTGAFISSWRPLVQGGAVFALNVSPDGQRLYVGGNFTKINGTSKAKIAAFDITVPTSPTLLTSSQFAAKANGLVNDIASTAGTVWAGGKFTKVGTQPRSLVAAFSATNGALLPFNVQISGAYPDPRYPVPFVNSLAESNGRLYIGGMFNTFNGVPQQAFGVVNEVTGVSDAGFVVPGILPTSYLQTIELGGGTVYISGRDDLTGNPARLEGVMAMDAATGNILWGSDGHRCLGDTPAMLVFKDLLWSGGHAHDCGQIGTHPETNPRWYAMVLAQDAITGQQLNFYPASWGQNSVPGSMSNVHAFATDGSQLFAGGGWLTVNGVLSENLVRFTVAKPSDPPAKVTVSASTRSTGGAAVSWKSSTDKDNRTLTYSVFRNASATPLTTFQADSAFWDRPQLTYLDSAVSPGQTVYYRVRVSDGDTAVMSLKSPTITIPPAPTSYDQAVLGDGASLYWRFDDAPGSTSAADATSNADNGTVTGTVNFVSSGALSTAPNGAVNLQGSGRLSSVATFNNPTAYSEELWFQTTTATGGKLIGFGNASGVDSTQYDRHVYMTDSGTLVFGVWIGSAKTVSSPSGYNDGAWHHLVATQGSDGMNLYVDGSLVGSDPNTQSENYVGYVRVGGDNLNGWLNGPTTYNFSGNLDEVAFYPYALNSAQVSAHLGLR